MASRNTKTGPADVKQQGRRLPGAQRYAQLLQIARQIILREGVGTLTMEALAQAAGVTKPIVYKHFQNSEDVTVAVLRDYADASIDYAVRRVEGASDLDDFFDRVIDSLFDFIQEHGALTRSITNGFSSSSRVDACFREMQDRALRIYRHLLIEQGVGEKQAPIASYALMAMMDSTILEYAGRGDEEDRRTLKLIVRATIGALIGGKRRSPEIPMHLLRGPAED